MKYRLLRCEGNRVRSRVNWAWPRSAWSSKATHKSLIARDIWTPGPVCPASPGIPGGVVELPVAPMSTGNKVFAKHISIEADWTWRCYCSLSFQIGGTTGASGAILLQSVIYVLFQRGGEMALAGLRQGPER